MQKEILFLHIKRRNDMTDPYKVLGVSPSATDDEKLKTHTESLQKSTTRINTATARSPSLRARR